MSVCLLVTFVSPTKTAEPSEMPFGGMTWVCPRNHVLDRGPNPPKGRAILGVVVCPTNKHGDQYCGISGSKKNNNCLDVVTQFSTP